VSRTTDVLKDDLLDPEVNHDPYPFFARLREEDPVHYSEAHRAWLVTRYDDVAAGLADLRLSSDRVRPLLNAMPEDKRATAGPVMELIADWMVVTDPPVHTRMRKLATKAFHPRKVVAMEDRIRALVDQYLDAFIAGGEQDLVAGFAFPLPATVISELIGAPVQDAERFKAWSQELALVAFGAGGQARAERHARALRSVEEMFEYFGALIDVKRAAPGDDMISDLIAGDDGDGLDDDEMKAMCALMLFAGHETTTTTITSAVKVLLENPEQLALVREDPKLGGKAVEEVLRVEGAIKVLHRWVVEDLELRGRHIKKGDRVLLIPAAANRDPEKFDDPDRFDITRSPNPHLAFGKGVHACIGAMLARIEMRVAVARMAERLTNLRFADDPPAFAWTPSLASRGLAELRVAHDA
jgi:cytochrome P450